MKRNYLLIRGHLGLGDTIICAPIVRAKSLTHDLVCVLAKHHNLPSTEYLFRDLPNVVVRGVLDDSDADFFTSQVWKDDVLHIGCFAPGFDGSEWDVSMYRQAGVEFGDRWNKWSCPRDENGEDIPLARQLFMGRKIPTPAGAIFVHQDRARGLNMDFTLFMDVCSPHAWIIEPEPITPILFHWRKVIEVCDEIHCIASSFAAFIDSIDLPKKPKLFLHAYARPGEPLMRVLKEWEVLL
jgi:hypothetical protein